MENLTGNLVIKKTIVKSKDKKLVNHNQYFGGLIQLGRFGFAENWVDENSAKLLKLKEAEKLFFNFINEDEDKNYRFELLIK